MSYQWVSKTLCGPLCVSSGVKSVDKREGGGSRNWGTYKDEIK